MLIQQEELNNLEIRYKASLINSLAGIKTAVLLGTQSEAGVSNLAIFNSLIHLGANPALYGLLFRPETVKRDSLLNILNKKQYTLNYVASGDFEKAHQTSAKYNSDVSEFKQVGYEEHYQQGFSAPFVKQAIVRVAMNFQERVDIKINGTVLVIGSIHSIEMEEKFVGSDGFVDLEKAGVLACSGLDAYYSGQLMARLSYARPDTWPEKI